MKKTIEQTIDDHVMHLEKEIATWKYLQEHGCNDPFLAGRMQHESNKESYFKL